MLNGRLSSLQMHVKQLFTSNTWHANNTTHTRLIITFICVEVLAGALGLGPNGLDARSIIILYSALHAKAVVSG